MFTDFQVDIKDIPRMGTLQAMAYTRLPNGQEVMLCERMFNMAIMRGRQDSDCWDEMWTFPTRISAMFGWWTWLDPMGAEPEGWIRHQPSNRRRKYVFCPLGIHKMGYLQYIHP